MPWVLNANGELEDQDKNQNENQTQDLSGGGGIGVAGSGAGAGTAATSSGAPTSSGNFTNFNKYLELNQPKTEGLGQKVASGVEAKNTAANSAIDQGEQEFNTSLSAAGPKVDQNQFDKLVNPTDLVDYVKDPNNVDAFKSDAKGQYSGPNAFSEMNNYQDLFDKVSGATKQQEQFKTSGGRQELVKGAYSDPSRAKAGMLGLDEALLGQTPSAYAPVKAQVDKTKDIQQKFDQISANATQRIADTKTAVGDRAKAIQDRFLGEGGVYNKLTSGIDQRVNDLTTSTTQAAQASKQFLDPNYINNSDLVVTLKDGTRVPNGQAINKALTPEVLNQLGVTKTQYLDMLSAYLNPKQFVGHRDGPGGYAYDPNKNDANVYHTGSGIDSSWGAPDFNEYVNFGSPVTANINRNTVATQDEYAQLAALEKLLGDGVNENFINAPDQSGKYNQDITDFDYQRLMDYLQNPRRASVQVTG